MDAAYAETIVFRFIGYNLLGSAVREVTGLLRGVSQTASQSSSQLATSLGQAGGIAASWGAALLTASVLVAGAMGYAASKAADFQSEIILLHTQARVAESQLNTLNQGVLNMAASVGFAPIELAKALYFIESVGGGSYTTAHALDELKAAAEGAAVGHADLATTASVLASVMAVFPKMLPIQAMGELDAIVGQGKMTMNDLDQALKTGILATLQSSGVSLADFGGALATMTDYAIPATQAANSLRMAIYLMDAPTAASNKVLKEFGLTSAAISSASSEWTTKLAAAGIRQAQLANDLRKPGGIIIAMEDLRNHLVAAGLDANTQAEVIYKAFGGGKMGKAIITLYENIGNGAKATDLALQKLGFTSTEIATLHDRLISKTALINQQMNLLGANFAYITNHDPAQMWKDFTAAIDALVVSLGQAFLPLFISILQWLTPMVQGLTTWINANQELVRNIGTFVVALLGIAGIALMIVGTLGMLAGAFIAIGSLGLSETILPMVGILFGIAAAIAAIGMAVASNWGAVSDFFSQISKVSELILHPPTGPANPSAGTKGGGAKTGPPNAGVSPVGPFGGNFDGIIASLGSFVSGVKVTISQLSPVWADMTKTAQTYFNEFNGFLAGQGPILQGILNGWKTKIETFIGDVTKLWNESFGPAVVGFISGFWQIIKDISRVGLTSLEGVIATGLQLLSGNWDNTWSDIKNYSSEISGQIGQIFADLGNQIWSVIGTSLTNIWISVVGFWDKFSKAPAFYIGLAAGYIQANMIKLTGVFVVIFASIYAQIAAWNLRMAIAAFSWIVDAQTRIAKYIHEHFWEIGAAMVKESLLWPIQFVQVGIAINTAIGSGITSGTKALTKVLSDFLIGVFLGTVLGFKPSFWDGIWQQLSATATTNLKTITSSVTMPFTTITSFFTKWFNQTIAQFNSFWIDFTNRPAYYLGYVFGFILSNGIQNILGKFLITTISGINNWGISVRDAIVGWIGKTVSGAIDAVKNHFPEIIGAIILLVTDWPAILGALGADIISGISKGIDSMKATVMKWFADATNWLGNPFPDVAKWAGDLGVTVAQGIWKGIISMKDWLINNVKGFMKGLLQGAQDAIQSKSPSKVYADEIGVPIAEGIWVGIQNRWPQIVKDFGALSSSLSMSSSGGLGSWVNSLILSLRNQSPSINKEVGGMLIGISKTISSFSTPASNLGKGLMLSVALGIPSGIAILSLGLKNAVQGSLGGLLAPSTLSAGLLGKNIVLGIWNGISSLASWLSTNIKNWLQGMIESAKGAIQSHSPSLLYASEIGIPIVEGIWQGVQNRWPQMKKEFASLSSSLTMAPSGLGSWLSGMITSLKSQSPSMNKEVSTMLAGVNKVVSVFSSQANKLGEGIIMAMAIGVAGDAKALSSILQTIMQNGISSLLKPATSAAALLGKSIVLGIWTGISSMASWLSANMQNWLQQMAKSAQSAVQSHSPSKVYADQIGVTIPQGIWMGIEQGWPKLEKQFTALAPSLTSPVSTSSPAWKSLFTNPVATPRQEQLTPSGKNSVNDSMTLFKQLIEQNRNSVELLRKMEQHLQAIRSEDDPALSALTASWRTG